MTEDNSDDFLNRVDEIIDRERDVLDRLADDDGHTEDSEMTQDTEGTDAEEMLDWLCWNWAKDGERFYPPKETAKECVENIEPADEVEGIAFEEGYHVRAYIEVVQRFEDLETRGFDPEERAKRHIRESRQRGLDLSDIDWSWWKDSRYKDPNDSNNVEEENCGDNDGSEPEFEPETEAELDLGLNEPPSNSDSDDTDCDYLQ